MFGGSRKDDQMLDQIFNLKFMGKQMTRQATKVRGGAPGAPWAWPSPHRPPAARARCHAPPPGPQCEKDIKKAREKIKKAIEKSNIEGARIYSQECITKKQEMINYMKLGSQIEAVAGMMERQAKMKIVNKGMGQVVGTLDKALRDTPLERVAMNMEKFEKIFESLDVQTSTVTNAMQGHINLSTPQAEVSGGGARRQGEWWTRPARLHVAWPHPPRLPPSASPRRAPPRLGPGATAWPRLLLAPASPRPAPPSTRPAG